MPWRCFCSLARLWINAGPQHRKWLEPWVASWPVTQSGLPKAHKALERPWAPVFSEVGQIYGDDGADPPPWPNLQSSCMNPRPTPDFPHTDCVALLIRRAMRAELGHRFYKGSDASELVLSLGEFAWLLYMAKRQGSGQGISRSWCLFPYPTSATEPHTPAQSMAQIHQSPCGDGTFPEPPAPLSCWLRPATPCERLQCPNSDRLWTMSFCPSLLSDV